MRYDNDTSGERLTHFCEAVGELQRRLAEQDIWVRGGISIGQVHVEEGTNRVLGSGLVRAYGLEMQHAKYARIVLDTALVEYAGRKGNREFISLLNHGSGLGGPTTVYDWLHRPDVGVRFEQDVPFFLDYLSPTVRSRNLRKRILHLVEANLSKASIEHYPKYDWVRRYLMSLYEGPLRYGDSEALHKELEQARQRLAGA